MNTEKTENNSIHWSQSSAFTFKPNKEYARLFRDFVGLHFPNSESFTDMMKTIVKSKGLQGLPSENGLQKPITETENSLHNENGLQKKYDELLKKYETLSKQYELAHQLNVQSHAIFTLLEPFRKITSQGFKQLANDENLPDLTTTQLIRLMLDYAEADPAQDFENIVADLGISEIPSPISLRVADCQFPRVTIAEQIFNELKATQQ